MCTAVLAVTFVNLLYGGGMTTTTLKRGERTRLVTDYLKQNPKATKKEVMEKTMSVMNGLLLMILMLKYLQNVKLQIYGMVQ